MLKNEDTIHEANLKRMARQREIAKALGFTVPGWYPGLVEHLSGLATLSMSDPEVSWKVSLLARRQMTVGKGTYLIETGSIELSNLTDEQFSAVLAAAVGHLPV